MQQCNFINASSYNDPECECRDIADQYSCGIYNDDIKSWKKKFYNLLLPSHRKF